MLRHILDPSISVTKAGLCALGIMTKAPRAGEVKTRLVPPLTPAQAAEINSCFLRDLAGSILDATHRAAAVGVGIYTPVGAEESYDHILPAEFCLLPQRGRDFGERLTLGAEDLFRTGFSSVCLINSDSPTVSAETFVEAVIELQRSGDRIVLGPSDDGGYYLIGLKQPHAVMFERIDWSTDRVFDQTKERASELGLELHELQAGYDVDDEIGLARLRNELLDGGARSDLAPHTQKFLRSL